MRRPEAGDCPPYYFRYIDQVPPGDVWELLASELEATLGLLASLSEAQGAFAYAPNKWTIKDVLAHVIDTERVFSYRALSFARQDPAALPDMDQDLWAASTGTGARTLAALLDELRLLRGSTLALFRGFDEAMLERTGVASGVSVRVRSIPWILAGHERHHRSVIEQRYLPGL